MNRPDYVGVLTEMAPLLRVPRDLREDAIQSGWLSIIVRGDSRGVESVMRNFVEWWESGGMTGARDGSVGGVGGLLSGLDPGVPTGSR